MDHRQLKAAQAAALGQLSSYAGNDVGSGPRQSFFEELSTALTELEMVLSDGNAALRDVRTRVLGSWPENVERPDQVRAVAEVPSLRDAAIATVRELTTRARQITEHAYALNGSL